MVDLLGSLTEYLQQQTEIDWRYYSDIHSNSNQPKGAVLIVSTAPVSNQKFLDRLAKNYRFKLRLLVGNADTWTAMQEAFEWQEKIINETMRSLFITGYNNLFEGINFVESNVFVRTNQDNGSTVAIEFLYDWSDDSMMAGDFMLAQMED
jgi:hypothetical protein